jgi:hypothetical protein
MRKLLGIATGALLLVGCATERVAYHPSGWYSDPNVDVGKVTAVNKWAEQKGAHVMWINYPQKPKSGE